MATQIDKKVSEWTDEELIQWGRDQAQPGRRTNDKELAREVYKRAGLEGEPQVEKAKEALKEIADEQDQQSEGEESVAEQEEREDEPKADKEPEPVQEPPKAEAPKPEPKKAESADMDTTELLVKENLDAYIRKMAPGVSHTGNEGPSNQVMLYRTIKTVLRQDGAKFNKLFGELLNTIHAHRKTVFNERYAFRYFDQVGLSGAERRNFERILNLLITTCDPSTRSKTIKQVDIDASMAGFRNPDMHQRVIAFYTQM